MLAAEHTLMDNGTSVEELMRLAGEGAAQQIWRISSDMPTLVLCGTGNNGGDGYVIARWLLDKGFDVAVAATGEPRTDAAKNAKSLWSGKTVSFEDARPRQQIVDCIFGTGLTRPMSPVLVDQVSALLKDAHRKVSVDIPSGIEADSGSILSDVGGFDYTIALGAFKPSHFLEPAKSRTGKLMAVDIGISASSTTSILSKPTLQPPSNTDHKYSRGLIAVVSGTMLGAAELSARAAQLSGAGYVKLFSPTLGGIPTGSVVSEQYTDIEDLVDKLSDPRISIILIGPGLGKAITAMQVLESVLEIDKPLLLDADALTLLGANIQKWTSKRTSATIATPHAGEFQRIHSPESNSKIETTTRLAKQSNMTIINKGADTVIANPAGLSKISTNSSPWLSTAGTGDVLAGIVASRFAVERNAFVAAQQGQWLHSRAAQLAGPVFSPEVLIEQIPFAIAECL